MLEFNYSCKTKLELCFLLRDFMEISKIEYKIKHKAITVSKVYEK